MRPWFALGLMVVILYGAAVRLVGIDFPVAYGPDQEFVVGLAVRVAGGDLNPHYAVYPGLAIYLPALVVKLVSVGTPFPPEELLTLALAQRIVNASDVARAAQPYYVGVRLLTATLGIATIALTYLYGAKAYTPRVGLIATALLAAAAAHAVESHFATADVPASFWTAATALVSYQLGARTIPEGGRPRTVRLALAGGALAGLAAATKLAAGTALLLPLTGAAMVAWRDRRTRSAAAGGWQLTALAAGGGALLAAGAGILIFQPVVLSLVSASTLSGQLPARFDVAMRAGAGAGCVAGILMLIWSIALARAPRGTLRDCLALPLRAAPLAVVGGAVAAFILTSPFFILDPRQSVGDLFLEVTRYGAVGHYGFDLAPRGPLYAPFAYVPFAGLPFSLGVPSALAAAAGVALALRRRTTADLHWLPFVLGTLAFLSIAPTVFVRYLLPLLPLLAVAAARALSELITGNRVRHTLGAAATAVVIAYGTVYSWQSTFRFADDTRAQAERALPTLISPGATVAVTEFRNYYPSIDPARYVVVPCPAGTYDPAALVACGAEFVLLSGMLVTRAERDPAQYDGLSAAVRALRRGELGYRRIASFRQEFLNQSLYARLDPMFEGYFVSPTIEVYRRT